MQSHPVSYYAIINALYQLLETTDFKKITINDICHQASISRSTFYKLFKDKYDILEQENQKICDTVDMALKVKSRLLCKMLYNVFTISTYQN